MIMYGIFFMFVVISISIIYVLVPMMSQPSAGTSGPLIMGFDDPCNKFSLLFPCGFFELMCVAFIVPSGIGCYYFALFFTVLIMQALFMGLIAGQLGENSVIGGVKHSLIMLAAVFVIFMFMLRTGLLPVT